MSRAPRVAVLDYDAGNLRSAAKALARAGADAFVTRAAAEAARSDALVVPGVGHFGQCVRQFRAAGLEQLVRKWVATDRPLLGVCVGMQILYRSSEEDPSTRGLGILPGQVRRLPGSVTVPHMGWNIVRAVGGMGGLEEAAVGGSSVDPLLDGVAGKRCYFVHSYYAAPDDRDHVIATCDYGPGFPCAVRVGRTVGTQFHPEKSGAVGGRLLANFVKEAVRQRAAA